MRHHQMYEYYKTIVAHNTDINISIYYLKYIAVELSG